LHVPTSYVIFFDEKKTPENQRHPFSNISTKNGKTQKTKIDAKNN